MEKLIELLNEYEVEKKPSRLQRNYYLGFVHNFGKGIMYIDEEGDVIDTGDMEGDKFIHMSEPEYRLIETSLKNEDELEQFLLQSIVIDNE